MNSEPEVKANVQAEQVQEELMSAESVGNAESVEVSEIHEEDTNPEEKTETQQEIDKADDNTSDTSSPQEVLGELSVKDKMQAFGQKLSVGHVVALMICILVLLIGSSLMIGAFRPVPEPEQTEEDVTDVTEEEEQPRVILLSSVSPDYIPVISKVYGEVSTHTDYDTMLSDLLCWVKEFGRINIREQSNTDSRVIGYVVYGEQLSTYGTEGDFTKVKYTDHQTGEPEYGFCYSAFLSKEEPDSAKVYLNVPLYKQGDPRWGSKMIGGYETLASAGCTTTCISMVESYVHGKDIFPNMMADQLPYTYDGLLTFPGRYSRYAGKDYLQVILNFLHSGMPVLVSGYTSDGRTHWVVVVGYNGDGIDMHPVDFVINDPGANRSTLADFFGNYPLFEKIVYYTG